MKVPSACLRGAKEKSEISMAQTAASPVNEPYEVTIWRAISAPVLFAWGLAGFLPLFALFGATDSVMRLIFEGLFLATGSVGALGLFIFAKFAGGLGHDKPAAMMIRGREKALRIYAFLWITAYTVFVMIVPA